MSLSYKEEVVKYKEFQNSRSSEDDIITVKRRTKDRDRPFILEIVYNDTSSFMKGRFKHGKYCTFKQAKQALEQIKKSQGCIQKYVKEYNIYNINNKDNILVNYTVPTLIQTVYLS
jgi:hypothetical protein